MSILIGIEELFRNRKIENQNRIFKEVQKVLVKLDLDSNSSDGVIYALASASNYETLKFTLTRSILAARQQLKASSDSATREYLKKYLRFAGFLKFNLDFYGGYLGFWWL